MSKYFPSEEREIEILKNVDVKCNEKANNIMWDAFEGAVKKILVEAFNVSESTVESMVQYVYDDGPNWILEGDLNGMDEAFSEAINSFAKCMADELQYAIDCEAEGIHDEPVYVQIAKMRNPDKPIMSFCNSENQ